MLGQPGKLGPVPPDLPCSLIGVLRSCPCSNLLADQGVMANGSYLCSSTFKAVPHNGIDPNRMRHVPERPAAASPTPPLSS